MELQTLQQHNGSNNDFLIRMTNPRTYHGA